MGDDLDWAAKMMRSLIPRANRVNRRMRQHGDGTGRVPDKVQRDAEARHAANKQARKARAKGRRS